MATKLRIAAGSVEFEYEGDQPLALNDIKDLLGQIESLATKAPAAMASSAAPVSPMASSPPGGLAPKLHVNSIAEKLSAKSGSDVARAAAASLQLVDGKDKFTRAELLARMKEATKYYKESMSSNLTKALETLLNGKFNQIGSDVYALSAAEHTALSSILAH